MKKYIQLFVLAIAAYFFTSFTATAQTQWSWNGPKLYTTANAVGIGITNPTSKLHVNGGFRVEQGVFVGGKVGIGFSAPDYTLEVNGSVLALNYYYYSDKRFKENIQPIEGALDKILALRGTSYTFRRAEFKDLNFSSGRQLGLIAQEVKEVLPELVSEDDRGYCAINYDGVIPILVEAMKEQQAQIKEKDTAIQNLEKKVGELESRLAKIEQLLANQSTGERSINVEQEQDFAVFPNPTKDGITVVFNLKTDAEMSISITDEAGRLVRQNALGRLATGEHSAAIDLSQIPNGVYFISSALDGKQVTKKIVVQR